MPKKDLVKLKLINGISTIATSSQKFKIINEKLDFRFDDSNQVSCRKTRFPQRIALLHWKPTAGDVR